MAFSNVPVYVDVTVMSLLHGSICWLKTITASYCSTLPL